MTDTFSPKALRIARAKARLTLEQLKDKSGVSMAQINRYEKGRVPPRDVTVIKLAEALNVDPSTLYIETE